MLQAGTRLGPRQLSLAAAVGRVVAAGPAPCPGWSSCPPVTRWSSPAGPLQSRPGVRLQRHRADRRRRRAGLPGRHGSAAVRDDAAAAWRRSSRTPSPAPTSLITSGGVSAGAFDVVKALLRRTGTVHFRQAWRCSRACRRGSGCSASGRVPVFCLPGNPVSSMVSFEVFVRPALRTLLGEAEPGPPGRPRGGPGGLVRSGRQAPVRPGHAAAGRRRPGAARTPRSPTCACRSAGRAATWWPTWPTADALAVVPEDVTEVVAAGQVLGCLRAGQGDARERPGRARSRVSRTSTPTGAARMVDVSAKAVTVREATATGLVRCSAAGGAGAARRRRAQGRRAGRGADRRHPGHQADARAGAAGPPRRRARCGDGRRGRATRGSRCGPRSAPPSAPGVEMEALTAVAVAGLAVVDMVKALDRYSEITDVRVVAKSGGRSGDWVRELSRGAGRRGRARVVTVSTSAAAGRAEDRSGPLLVDGLRALGLARPGPARRGRRRRRGAGAAGLPGRGRATWSCSPGVRG